MAKTRASSRQWVGTAEFKARSVELLQEVREARTEYVVTRHGKPVAQLIPFEPEAPASPVGTMRGTLIRFDQPFDPVPATWSLDQGEQG